jgi:hypothetical protein
VKEAEDVSDDIRRLAAAFDGSRQKDASLNGVATAASHEAGKVFDVGCLTEYCQGYQIHTGKHKQLVNSE